MIEIQFFLTLLIFFALIYLTLGLWAARSVNTLQNYFLANRDLSITKLTFALIASQLGSGMILGTAYRAYHIGIWGILYSIGMSIGFIILGCGLASRMRNLGIATTAEIFETHYHSKYLKMIASILSIISLWGILVAQIVASKTLFGGLGIIDPYIFMGCWLFVICYTMLGGLQSIIIVDIAQVSFIITIFFATIIYTLPQLKLINIFETSSTILHENYVTSLLPAMLVPILFSLIEQDVAQKFFAAKSQRVATISAFIAAIFLIVFSCIPLTFGILAKTQNLNIQPGANPLIVLLMKICPQTLFLLMVCGIIAAITSTANSLMCAISSNVIQDFENTLNIKNNRLLITKIVSAVVGLSALIGSYGMTGDIISILEESYRISIMCLFIPTIRAYFGKPTSSIPAWISCTIGFVGYIATHFMPLSILMKDIIPLLASCIGYIVSQWVISIKNQ